MDPLIRAGERAPAFALPDIGGRIYRLDQARGRVLVLDFWSSECRWSARAEESIGRLEGEWGEAVAVWRVASNAGESSQSLEAAAGQRPGLVLLRDQAGQVADAYGVQTTPHLFVVDAQGILRYQGALDDVTFRQRTPTRSYLAEAVAAVLSGREPDPVLTPAYGCAIVRRGA